MINLRYNRALDSRPFESKKQSSGDKLRKKYVLDVAPDGTEKLVEVGDVDIQAEIDSHASACDLKTIIARHEMLGTIEQLAQGNGGIIDLTKLPGNLHEVKKIISKAELAYDALKPELKKKYPTMDDFLANFASVNALQAFIQAHAKQDPASNNVKKEVKDSAPDT